ncbi:MAG: hypothetical protein AABY93_10705 [Bacteroidota bacterium]
MSTTIQFRLPFAPRITNVSAKYVDNALRSGFVIQLETTDLPGCYFSIDHFKIWSMLFDHTFVLLGVPSIRDENIG